MSNKSSKPEKQWYSVKLEVMVPAEITYRILATDESEAIQLSLKQSPSEPPRFRLPQMKRLSAKVYKAGTSLLKLSKKL